MRNRRRGLLVVGAVIAGGVLVLLRRPWDVGDLPTIPAEGQPSSAPPALIDQGPEVLPERESPIVDGLTTRGGAPGWIHGRVKDAVNAAPIKGATARLVTMPPHLSQSHGGEVRTGEDGVFHFDVLVHGKARLEVSAPGYDRRTLQLTGVGPRLELGDVALSTSAVASLRVVDVDGSPVPGAAAFWRECHNAVVWGGTTPEVGFGLTFYMERPTAITDSSGRVTLPDARFGAHRLLIVKDGFRCHLRDVRISEDSVTDLGVVTLEAAPRLDIALQREDHGEVHVATVQQEISECDTLVLRVAASKVPLPSPPVGRRLVVSAEAYEADGTFWGQLKDGPTDGVESAVVVLRSTVPAVRVRWQGDPRAQDPLTMWCFAVDRGVLWEQATAVRSIHEGSWVCWPRRGREVRFLAWSAQLGLGKADAIVPSPRSMRPVDSPRSDPELEWRGLERRVLRILTADHAPAVDAVVVGEVELTDDLAGAAIGGNQRPRAFIARTSDADGVADLGAVGGLRFTARVTMQEHAPLEVQVAPDAPAETLVQLARGGEVVVRIGGPMALHSGLRLGIQAKGREPQWFPVTGTEMRLGQVELGPADVILDAPVETSALLDPPVLDVRTIGSPDTTIEIDRVGVVVGGAPVWADLSVARGPIANLTVIAPRPMRVAITPIGARVLPKQRAFACSRKASITRVCGLYEGNWIVELLDSDLQTLWWREIQVLRTPEQLTVALPASSLPVDGGPSEAQGTLSPQLRDGRTLSWLVVPLRVAAGVATSPVPEGRYRVDLGTSDGAWRGVAIVDSQRIALTSVPR